MSTAFLSTTVEEATISLAMDTLWSGARDAKSLASGDFPHDKELCCPNANSIPDGESFSFDAPIMNMGADVQYLL